jgi:hypothetical protein
MLFSNEMVPPVSVARSIRDEASLMQSGGYFREGPVRNVVGIRSGIISGELFIPYYAARSNC